VITAKSVRLHRASAHTLREIGFSKHATYGVDFNGGVIVRCEDVPECDTRKTLGYSDKKLDSWRLLRNHYLGMGSKKSVIVQSWY
jgi:hypothetical protein